MDLTSTLHPGEKLQVPLRIGWVYEVADGNTLSGIAAGAGVSVATLARANHLDANTAVLRIGERLWIPHEPPAQPETAGHGAAPTRHATHTAPQHHSLGLLWPVRGPITSPFGWRYLFGRRDFHEGIDIGVPTGTPVHAAMSGTVVGAGWDGPFGIAVRVRAGDMLTLYAHNSRVVVHAGESVRAGQLLSYSGMTGNATGPHVHFGVYINSVPVNPMRYLP